MVVVTAVTSGMAVSALLSIWQEVEHYAKSRRQLMLATAQVFASATASSVAEHKQRNTGGHPRDRSRARPFVRAGQDIGRQRFGCTRWRFAPVTDPLLGAKERPSVVDLLHSETVLVSVPIINGGREVGRINLISDTADLWPRLLSSLWLHCSHLQRRSAGLLIAWRFQRAITQPLRRLLEAMQEVRRDHHYDVRVEEATDQEIGQLVDGFNAMLGDIRDRDDG